MKKTAVTKAPAKKKMMMKKAAPMQAPMQPPMQGSPTGGPMMKKGGKAKKCQVMKKKPKPKTGTKMWTPEERVKMQTNSKKA